MKKDGRTVIQTIDVLMNHGAPPYYCQINSPRIRDFVVVSPQLPKYGPWEKQNLEAVNAILTKEIYTRFHGDPARTFLTGFSVGAEAVFDFVSSNWMRTQRGKIAKPAALWPVDDVCMKAGRDPCDEWSQIPIWLHFGTREQKAQNATCENLELNSSKPFGKRVPKEKRLFTGYTALKFNHIVTCLAAYADQRVYKWLLQI